ncbi:MAG: hypothetical protein WBB35_00135, partial [Saprospiraceae bacterium]
YNGYRKKNNTLLNYRLKYPSHDSLNQADDRELTWQDAKTLTEFSSKTGYETHGIELNADELFIHVPLPDPALKGHIYPVAGYDFRLKPSSRAIDAGCLLPNINDEYLGKAPDLGALEHGGMGMEYGPRH